jgi:hypothetical protein
MVGIFDCDRAEAAAGQGDRHSCKWRDGVIVPVICPTCQNVFERSVKTPMPKAKKLLCMGLFSIFLFWSGWHAEP